MPVYFRTWSDAFFASMQNLWFSFMNYLPAVAGALLILLLGLIVAWVASGLIYRLLSLARIDMVLDRLGVRSAFERYGIDFSLAKLSAWTVRWFVLIATFIAVADALRITQVSQFLNTIALYVPNVIAAIVILGVGFVVGDFVSTIVSSSAAVAHMDPAPQRILKAVSRWSIIVFALLAALVQLGIAKELIQILFTGLVFMVALAGGIAFGLGGKDAAHDISDSIARQMGGAR